MAERIGRDQVEQALPSAARIATPAAPEYVRGTDVKGIMLFVDVTALAATPIVTISIEAKTITGNDWEPVATFAAISATGHTILILYPGVVETGALANVQVQGLPLPVHFRINFVHTDADSITYSADLHALE